MKTAFTTLAALSLLAAPFTAFATEVQIEVHGGAHPTSKSGAAEVRTNAMIRINAKIDDAKERADKEISRRVDSLQDLAGRIAKMVRVSADSQTSLQSTITAQISALNALQAQIAGETATSSLRAQIQSITDSYRIYALIMPQISIMAAAERIKGIAAQLDQIVAKIDARVSAGATLNTEAAAALTDMKAKIADAKAKVQDAIDEVSILKPDNSDLGLKQSNLDALKDAHAKIRAAQQSLVAARKDAGVILKSFREANNTASTTVKASGEIQVELH